MSFTFQYFINKIKLIFPSHIVYVSIFYQQNYSHHSVSYRLCFNILINKIMFTFSVSYHFINFLCHTVYVSIFYQQNYIHHFRLISFMFQYYINKIMIIFLSHIIYVSIFYQQNDIPLSVAYRLCFNILSTK